MTTPASAGTGYKAAPRILITRIGAMGDVLHALPAVTALRRDLPDAEIGWAIDPRWAPLLDRDLIDHVHLVPTRLWKQSPLSPATARSILALRRELRAIRYDLAVDLQGTLRSAMVNRLSRAPRLLGPAASREAPARLLYREPIRTPAVHVIDQAADLLIAALGRPLEPSPAVSLPIDPAAELWADQQLASRPSGSPIVLLAPTAGWGAKMWPADRFAALAAHLATAGALVLINASGPDDRVAQTVAEGATQTLAQTVARRATQTLAQTAAQGVDPARVRPVVSTLPQLIALVRRADLVIAGDTGPLYLATTLHRPVVALFGPTDPARNGPWPPHPHGAVPDPATALPPSRNIVLRDPSSVTDHTRRSDPDPGLLRITVDQVLRAALAMLEQTHPSGPTIRDPRP